MRFLTRVSIRNYKSIESCDVELGDLTFLVGPNGSGKSNFLDALAFVSDALRKTLREAVRDRGGPMDVFRRQSLPDTMSIRLDFALPDVGMGFYRVVLVGGPRQVGVLEEQCVIGSDEFHLIQGWHAGERSGPGPGSTAGLHLMFASGELVFKPVYDALAEMSFHNLAPDAMRIPHPPDAGDRLRRDAANAGSVIERLAIDDKPRLERIVQYLSAVVPGITDIATGPGGVPRFHHGEWFDANAMSDGTLRVLGILLALFNRGTESPLVAIEEPEIALHPGASEVLLDALREASEKKQLIVTTHSPDLLDLVNLDSETVLAVANSGHGSVIAPINRVNRDILREGLYSLGELLRDEQLKPDPTVTTSALSDLELP